MASPPRENSVRDTKNMDSDGHLQDIIVLKNTMPSDGEEDIDKLHSVHQSSPHGPVMRDLRALLKTLPQELYDEIYDITFTAKAGIRDIGTKPGRALHREHLKLLQIDSTSRAHYAKTYYGNGASFRLAMGDHIKWLKSLAPAHKFLLRDLIYVFLIRGPSKISHYLIGSRNEVLQGDITRNVEGGQELIKYLRAQLLPMIGLTDCTPEGHRTRDAIIERYRAGLVQDSEFINVPVSRH